jgi:DNA-nicking Smr family endonuclease
MAKRAPDPETAANESELFRRSVGEVMPLRNAGRVAPARKLPHPLPLQRWRDELAALRESLSGESSDGDLETGEELSFVRDGIGAHALRKLRRGHWVVQDEIDLHGLTAAEALETVAGFLAQCTRRGLRCVRIVHGKGLRSRNRQPVLKPKIAAWLMRRDEILAFCQAPSAEGGAGAMMVLLKGGRRKEERGRADR